MLGQSATSVGAVLPVLGQGATSVVAVCYHGAGCPVLGQGATSVGAMLPVLGHRYLLGQSLPVLGQGATNVGAVRCYLVFRVLPRVLPVLGSEMLPVLVSYQCTSAATSDGALGQGATSVGAGCYQCWGRVLMGQSATSWGRVLPVLGQGATSVTLLMGQ